MLLEIVQGHHILLLQICKAHYFLELCVWHMITAGVLHYKGMVVPINIRLRFGAILKTELTNIYITVWGRHSSSTRVMWLYKKVLATLCRYMYLQNFVSFMYVCLSAIAISFCSLNTEIIKTTCNKCCICCVYCYNKKKILQSLDRDYGQQNAEICLKTPFVFPPSQNQILWIQAWPIFDFFFFCLWLI